VDVGYAKLRLIKIKGIRKDMLYHCCPVNSLSPRERVGVREFR